MAHGESFLQTGKLQVNLLAEEDHGFATSIGSWTATNATLSVAYDNLPISGYNALLVTPTDYSAVVLSCDPGSSRLLDANDNIEFHSRFRSENDVIVQVDVARDGEGATSRTQTVPGKVWKVIRSQPIPIPNSGETYQVTPTITVQDHGGQPFIIQLPVLMPEFAFTENIFLRECVPLIPSVFNDQDLDQTFPTLPMYRFMDLGLSSAGVGYAQFIHFKYRDAEAGRDVSDEETLSGLVDPTICEPRFLPWLSQFTGTQYVDPTIRTTPWGNLPQNWADLMLEVDPATNVTLDVVSLTRASGSVTAVLDGDVTDYAVGETVIVSGAGDFNGQFIVTGRNIGSSTVEWSQDEADDSATVGTVGLVDQSWIEIEAFRIDITNRIEFLRWQVENQFYGIRAGTLDALEKTIQFYLTGNKTVTIYPKHQGVPFLIKVFTKTNETPGGVEGESSQEIIDALRYAKPAGFKIEHECNAAGSDSLFVLGSSTDGLLSSSLL